MQLGTAALGVGVGVVLLVADVVGSGDVGVVLLAVGVALVVGAGLVGEGLVGAGLVGVGLVGALVVGAGLPTTDVSAGVDVGGAVTCVVTAVAG